MPDITRTTTEVKVKPDGVLPVYNENIIVLSSPNIQSADFRWLIDVAIFQTQPGGGPPVKTISSLVILPNPDGYGVIDIHRHLENYITNDFNYSEKSLTQVYLDTFKSWYINATESFTNTKWAFDDNYTIAPYDSFVGWTNFTEKHPYKVGDVINIAQDPGATFPAYDGEATVTVVLDDYTFITDKSRLGDTPVEGGVSNLVFTGSRTIEQPSIGDDVYSSFNGVFNFKDFITYDYSLYNCNPTTPAKLLTNKPLVYKMRYDSNCWIQAYSEDNANLNGVIVQSNNGVFYITLPTNALGPSNKLKRLKIGPKDILDNVVDTPFVLLGTLPMIDNTTESYTFFFCYGTPGGSSIAATSEVHTIEIEDICSKYENITLFFLDRLGSFIPFNFNKVSRSNLESNRSNFSKNYGEYNSTENTWGYNSYDRGTTNYDIVTTKKVTCTSDWLDSEQNDLIQILMTSPDVYYLDSDGDMVAVHITTTSYEEKKKVNDKLINYTITFEYSQNNRNQRA